MDYSRLIDLHTHSSFSPDGEAPPELMLERAAELGLSAYAVTDHCDCNYWYPADGCSGSLDLKDIEMYGAGQYALESIAAQSRLKELYKDRLNFLCGIELGQPLQSLENAEKLVSDPRLDFVIGSHHQNKGQDDFYLLKYDEMELSGIYSLLDAYFGEMLDMCRWGKFDVLGHLTYPLRYIEGDYGTALDLDRYEEIIREIFRVLIQKGKGIEINTSGLRQKYGRTFPTLEYVRTYREMGGEILTVGSDAHRVSDLAAGTAAGAEIAKAAGFRYLTYFKERKAVFEKL
ncbi:histidinol-phosphatase HisJ family protein [Ruminococcus sp. Marseille-P6503]|uniref:histidinol-phosphatase HisJ family protein n=1 Tax=Ruminococcus sp. Marseille-P6503 TaxID=2364796 RepID=UPI000F51B3F8|nr:histidinol-phosphatase HisJ family protein [Ruminococcus sp. Marseille-P6503]